MNSENLGKRTFVLYAVYCVMMFIALLYLVPDSENFGKTVGFMLAIDGLYFVVYMLVRVVMLAHKVSEEDSGFKGSMFDLVQMFVFFAQAYFVWDVFNATEIAQVIGWCLIAFRCFIWLLQYILTWHIVNE